MKIEIKNYSNREVGPVGDRPARSKKLEKIYETPKSFLKEPLEVIEISVQENLETLFKHYTDWRRGNGKRPEYIFNMIQDFAFVSILPKIVRKNYDFIIKHGEEFSEIISTAVSELTKHRRNRYKEMISIYSSIYEELNERRIKKIMSLDLKDINWDDALKLCIVSHGSPSHTMNNTLKMMYSILKFNDYESVRKLLVKLYGKKDMPKVAVYILLEKRPDFTKSSWIDSELYSVLTSIALDEINKLDKKEIKKLLKLYCHERRKSEFEQYIRRRISLSSINKEDYKKIRKVMKKLAKKNEMYRNFLDMNNVKKKNK